MQTIISNIFNVLLFPTIPNNYLPVFPFRAEYVRFIWKGLCRGVMWVHTVKAGVKTWGEKEELCVCRKLKNFLVGFSSVNLHLLLQRDKNY